MNRSSSFSPAQTSFEIIPDEEDGWRKEITALTVQLQEKRKALQEGEILRGVHAKSHGCLDAEFIVNSDLPEHLRVGLFARPGRCFSSKIRFSNADVLKRADIEKVTGSDGSRIMKHGSRGMAIKVLDVEGAVLMMDGTGRSQDFLMVNTPEFAFRNVRDYRRLTLALVASENGATPDLFFLPAEMLKLGMMDMSGALTDPAADEPPRQAALRALYKARAEVFADFGPEDMLGVLSAVNVVQKIQSTAVRNPLNVPYFSAAPFRFGPRRVMRYSVAPVTPDPAEKDYSHDAFENSADNYLSEALGARIGQNALVKLSFRVQVAETSDIVGKEEEMIENAARAWDEAVFPFVEVARIVIDPTRQKAPLVDACKPELFTPWHALSDHEPLGGINRLRKPVYATSATYRRTT